MADSNDILVADDASSKAALRNRTERFSKAAKGVHAPRAKREKDRVFKSLSKVTKG